MKIVVGMTGATGAIWGIRTLEVLRELGIESHLILSKWAEATIALETAWSVSDVKGLASKVYAATDQAAAVSSGSFPVDGMIIAPCSMKTLASIRYGLADNLISRAADVTIKESRTLVIVPRETPLSAIHLENMLRLAELGVRIVPPMPAFYNHPQTIADIVDHTVARALDQLHIESNLTRRWKVTEYHD
ncbi:UbiX family flavin prenyltransferase [Alicyclobacillus cycloheptanicus]|uniref:Flavin prenyltransferase UbiX n=1 Tax=Alicyclobacillus cycloheptanicus TaxID=1457 RepID=A0ABT9XFI1_9BACL|nr:UbiX family flavin prenyltransferase [Alicyclobacillus cycloheptanicus]MDQ0189052.1 4-hydroxy-3-polyprenylbenzoate decarboxylase [Alicyclobacillus cycloheptanicus]WDM00188.1 UbiX family flavin prenyltransferase [Alicyclobacillus cycloheptanicus]